MASREETNFSRLLHRCETMASEKQFDGWRLDKYVGTLQDYLQRLRTLSTNKPPQEVLADYTRKVDFLKGLIEAEKLTSNTDRVLAADLLAPGLKSTDLGTPSKELHLQTKARYQREAREELMSDKFKEHNNGFLRQRHKSSPSKDAASELLGSGVTSTNTGEDLDTVIKHQQEVQEKLAEEMISLTRNLKEHAYTAHRIVKDDTKKLVESNQLADGNYGKLKVESERLEQHVQRSCNCWVWIMLIAVCVTFVWMVVFMRMFPKR